MPCLVIAIALFLPRLALFLMLVFSHWIGRAFEGWLIPVLGFFFLPYSTVWYVVVMNLFHGNWGLFQVAFMVLAMLTDFSSHGWTLVRRKAGRKQS